MTSGRATAKAFAQKGILVVAADIDAQGLRETVDGVLESGGRAEAAELDVTDREQIKDLVGRVNKELGLVSILVNGAGNLKPTQVIDIREDEWDSIVDVNLKGTFLCSQAVLSVMSRTGWGRIINISSTAGKNVSTVGWSTLHSRQSGDIGFHTAPRQRSR